MSAGLNGTINGPELAKPALPNQAPQVDPDAEANAATTDAYSQLGTLLSQWPDVDYQAKFQPMIDQVQKRETTKMPSGMAMFAAALGAPREAPKILASRWEQMNNEQSAKDRDLLALQHSIMQGEVAQEIEKGNFAKALKQSEVLGKLQHTLSRIDREELEKEWNRKRIATNADRMTLLETKGREARSLAREKVKELAEQFHLNEKQALALQTSAASLMESLLSRQNMMSGDPSFTPAEASDIVAQVYPQMVEIARGAQDAVTPPPPAAPGAAPAAPGPGLQQRLDALRARVAAPKAAPKTAPAKDTGR